ncbi:hypothetical protein BGZ79_000476, partial [Entomortierella chlamydospora]
LSAAAYGASGFTVVFLVSLLFCGFARNLRSENLGQETRSLVSQRLSQQPVARPTIGLPLLEK